MLHSDVENKKMYFWAWKIDENKIEKTVVF